MALLTSAPRGTKDIVPAEAYKWQYLEGILRETARDFGFTEIRFPTFEHTELFLRGVGDTTDVVQKEMYTFEDKGGRSISLRPEGTASVVRSLIENSLYAAGFPVKVYYIAPNFRYEKPQAGRLREHHQFGVEYFGAAGPDADAETIAVAYTYLKRLGIKGVELRINSLGCPKCRPAFHEALHKYFSGRESELCPTCGDRLGRNPLRILDCKSPVCQAVSHDAPVGLDFLCGDCCEHFEGLKSRLEELGIGFTVDPRIVRGLDYYTRTVFEFVSTEIGSQGTVCGGGRYDGLVGLLGGPETPGLGFGSGLERLLLVMEAQGVEIPKPSGTTVFVAAASPEAEKLSRKLVFELRQMGIAAGRDTMGRSLKAQMKYADRLDAEYSLVLGGDEIASGRGILKNMRTGEQYVTKIDAESVAKAAAVLGTR
jgi:histidyl-tRNA synthetase